MKLFEKLFRGYVRLRITGAAPQTCLNKLTERGIPFRELLREDELHYSFCVSPQNAEEAERLAMSAYCTAERVEYVGWKTLWQRLRRRPMLVVGMLCAVFFSFFLQTRVWVIEVHGNERLYKGEIVHALEELGIQPGASATAFDQQELKLRMLNLLPELSWIAVNRNGGVLTVLVTERSDPTENATKHTAANLVAVRDGVLTEVSVLEGMRLCQVGDTVRKGQILVSGFEDYGLCIRGVCAQGEIYGQTWHRGILVTTCERTFKAYTGREWKSRAIIFGRKRINLSGNSGISYAECDKMIDRIPLHLPGYTFPIVLETVTYREYTPTRMPITETEAEKLLRNAWERMTNASMVAGKLEETKDSLQRTQDCYILTAESICNEMLARSVPLEPIYGGDTNE